MQEDLHKTLKAIDLISGTSYANAPLKDPKLVFELLDRYILHKIVDTPDNGNRKGLAIVIRYIETITPAVDSSMLSGELGANLIKVLNWANDPGIRGADVTLCLVAEALGDVSRRLVENPFISKVEVDLPDEPTRERFAKTLFTDAKAARDVAREGNGLTLVGLAQAVGSSGDEGKRVDLERLREAKKELIEKQCFGLVEFVAPSYDLDTVVAPAAVKERLEQDVRLFKNGRLDALPMGYLLCGVIGTGKTFTAMCLAGSLGIPTIVFKNLRSKWVGSSEGNLQKVLSVIKALGPVVVVIDEADAALGSRAAGGDSGTSSRMFAMISSLMSDTRYRGKILWMLLTCRPDLLPVDLKRQGRCEVHIPLFPPETEAQRKEMFLAMARKNGVAIDGSELPPLPAELSGADIESLLVQCVRRAAIAGAHAPTAQHVRETLAHFRTPDYGLEKELQQLVAIRESTDSMFIPQSLRERYATPEKGPALEHRIQEIASLLQ
jgi:AAA+ superfamily predicted ATPase